VPLATQLADQADALPVDAWLPQASADELVASFRPADRQSPPRGAITRHFGAGHTDNDLVVHAVRMNVVHTGDLIFNGLHPFFDQNAGVTSLGWINSLNEIEKLCDEETIVVPGHGPVGDKSIVVEMRRYIEQLRASVKTDIGNGVSKEDAQAKTYDFMEGLKFGQLRPIAIGAVYDELTSE
ncbi:MAG: MBL fold metallo-hydrolase, partial [Planctomycetota bacterium]